MTETAQYFLKHQCDDESLQPLARLPMLIQLFVGLYKERLIAILITVEMEQTRTYSISERRTITIYYKKEDGIRDHA